MADQLPTEQRSESDMTVQLQVMSDLHLETPRFMPMYTDFSIERKCSHLALLGDIGSVHDERLFSFLEEQLSKFSIVFYVLGNHEPYRPEDFDKFDAAGHGAACTFQVAIPIMEEFEATITARAARYLDGGGPALERFVFLNRKRFDLSPTVTVLGATLFSRISEGQRRSASLFISDFSNIDGWTVDAHNAAHEADLRWLNGQVEALEADEPGRSVVVLTHYSPTAAAEANDPEHADDDRGVQTAFVTDLSREPCWTSPCVKAWVFGHTHFGCDFVDSGTGKRVVANQRGYGREDAFDFDPEKVISIQ